MAFDAPAVWLILGAVLVALEAFGVPGIGFLFTGLGALCTGLLLYSGITGDVSGAGQVAWFFGFAVVWTAVLWKPMQKWRMPAPDGAGYSNMVGERAEVAVQGLARGKGGQVKWSGAIMNAELAEGGPESVPGGASVEIVAVKGNTLVVRPVP